MLIEAVVFDLDGVICRTDRLHFQAWGAVANRLGIPFDKRVSARLRGVLCNSTILNNSPLSNE